MHYTMNRVNALIIYLILPSIPSTRQGSAKYNIKITDIGTMNTIKVIKTRQMHAVLDFARYTRELLNSIIHSSFFKFIGVGFTLCDKIFYLTQYLFNASTPLDNNSRVQRNFVFEIKQRTLTEYLDCVRKLSTCVSG